jgi:hypothetical protein
MNKTLALFVRVTGTDRGTVLTRLDTTSPLAVLQLLPDDRGVARLDR